MRRQHTSWRWHQNNKPLTLELQHSFQVHRDATLSVDPSNSLLHAELVIDALDIRDKRADEPRATCVVQKSTAVTIDHPPQFGTRMRERTASAMQYAYCAQLETFQVTADLVFYGL
jgi:hypothetical protein